MYLVWCMHYILHSYNKGSYRKENVIKKIIRKGKYIYTMFSILCISGPTQFQCVIQGSTEVETIFTLQQTNSPIFPDFQSQKVTSLLFSVEKIKSSGRKDFYLPASGVHTIDMSIPSPILLFFPSSVYRMATALQVLS